MYISFTFHNDSVYLSYREERDIVSIGSFPKLTAIARTGPG